MGAGALEPLSDNQTRAWGCGVPQPDSKPGFESDPVSDNGAGPRGRVGANLAMGRGRAEAERRKRREP